MQNNAPETVLIILISILLALLLVGFIVAMLFWYRRNNQQHQKKMQLASAQFQQELLTAQLEIQEDTFKNIAEEIHDNIGQTLSLAKFNIAVLPVDATSELFEPLKGTKELLNTAIEDLRNLSHGLHSDRLIKAGLVDTIYTEAEHINRTGKIKAPVNIKGDSYRLGNDKEIILFRIFQESVNNIIKHAGATEIETSLLFDNNTFTLKIHDNGKGFDVEALQKKGGGLGLTSMANRAKLIGADFSINSSPQNGTEILLILKKLIPVK